MYCTIHFGTTSEERSRKALGNLGDDANIIYVDIGISRCALDTNVIFTLVTYVLVPIVSRIRSLIADITHVRSRFRKVYVFNVWYKKYGSRRNIH